MAVANVRRRGMGSPEPPLRQRPLDLHPHLSIFLGRQPCREHRTSPLGQDIRVTPSPQRPGRRTAHHWLLIGQRRGERVERRGMRPIAQGDCRRPQQTTSFGPSQRCALESLSKRFGIEPENCGKRRRRQAVAWLKRRLCRPWRMTVPRTDLLADVAAEDPSCMPGRRSAAIGPWSSIDSALMHRLASSTRGSTNALVGQASRQAVQVPQ